MKNLFEESRVKEIKDRLNKLKPDSERLWGKMNAAQMVAHCSEAMKMALGDMNPPRVFLGRTLGFIIKPLALRNDEPMRRNSATVKGLVVQNDRELETERNRLYLLIDRFAKSGTQGLSKHPHSFFGRLTGEEWAILMYKHLDHHLRQFGV
jgi:Protein of unknown function (DUF1569)